MERINARWSVVAAFLVGAAACGGEEPEAFGSCELTCGSSSDCGGGRVCRDGCCLSPCSGDGDCASGEECALGVCVEASVDPCGAIRCENGTCALSGAQPFCTCDIGYAGPACDSCAPGFQDYPACVEVCDIDANMVSDLVVAIDADDGSADLFWARSEADLSSPSLAGMLVVEMAPDGMYTPPTCGAAVQVGDRLGDATVVEILPPETTSYESTSTGVRFGIVGFDAELDYTPALLAPVIDTPEPTLCDGQQTRVDTSSSGGDLYGLLTGSSVSLGLGAVQQLQEAAIGQAPIDLGGGVLEFPPGARPSTDFFSLRVFAVGSRTATLGPLLTLQNAPQPTVSALKGAEGGIGTPFPIEITGVDAGGLEVQLQYDDAAEPSYRTLEASAIEMPPATPATAFVTPTFEETGGYRVRARIVSTPCDTDVEDNYRWFTRTFQIRPFDAFVYHSTTARNALSSAREYSSVLSAVAFLEGLATDERTPIEGAQIYVERGGTGLFGSGGLVELPEGVSLVGGVSVHSATGETAEGSTASALRHSVTLQGSANANVRLERVSFDTSSSAPPHVRVRKGGAVAIDEIVADEVLFETGVFDATLRNSQAQTLAFNAGSLTVSDSTLELFNNQTRLPCGTAPVTISPGASASVDVTIEDSDIIAQRTSCANIAGVEINLDDAANSTVTLRRNLIVTGGAGSVGVSVSGTSGSAGGNAVRIGDSFVRGETSVLTNEAASLLLANNALYAEEGGSTLDAVLSAPLSLVNNIFSMGYTQCTSGCPALPTCFQATDTALVQVWRNAFLNCAEGGPWSSSVGSVTLPDTRAEPPSQGYRSVFPQLQDVEFPQPESDYPRRREFLVVDNVDLRFSGVDTRASVCGVDGASPCGVSPTDLRGVVRTCPTEDIDCFSIGPSQEADVN